MSWIARIGTLVVAVLISSNALAQDLRVRAEPSTLLEVDRHRASIVDAIVGTWQDALFVKHGAAAGQAQADLRAALMGLRADRLLAASLAGSYATLDALIADGRSEAATRYRVSAKNLGDAVADLTYTPVNPCRIVDTRNAGGVLVANTARTFDGYNAASFAAQGGTASDCGMPSGVSAIAMNVYAVSPTALGFIKVWGANASEPAVSTVNYQPGITAIATGAIVPVDGANSNRFQAKSPAAVHFIVDVVGYFRAPFWLMDANDNTSLGAGAGGQPGTASGYRNTAFGAHALAALQLGNDNTAVGRQALASTTDGGTNTAVGAGALYSNDLGDANTGVGYTALFNNTGGFDNTAVGRNALASNSTGSGNVAVGRDALQVNTIGLGNTAIGAYSLPGTGGTLNSAVGFSAMHGMTSGSYNVAIGWESLLTSNAGSWNTAVGSQALRNVLTGTNMTVIGAEALENLNVGTNNIAIGYQAAINLLGGDNNIYLGNEGVASESGTMRIGSGLKHTKLYLAGVVGQAIGSASTMLIDGTGRVGTIVSSARYKERIEAIGDASDALLRLRPVKFVYKGQAGGPWQFGLIAEEVADVLPELVGYSTSGAPETVFYHEMPALLLDELQKEHARIETQRGEIAEQRKQIADLQEAVQRLQESVRGGRQR